ncbi:unnamed protein product, partial [Tetraodon nigroviridis]
MRVNTTVLIFGHNDLDDGPPVVGHYDISDTDSDQESMSVEAVRPTVIKHELKTHRGQDLAAHSGCIRALSSNSVRPEHLEGSSLSTVLSGKNAPYIFCLLSRLKNLPFPFSAPQCVWPCVSLLRGHLSITLFSSAVSQKGLKLLTVRSCSRFVTPALSLVSGHQEAKLSHKEDSHLKSQISVASSDSEVEIVGVQEKARCAHPSGGVIKSLSSWKENSVEQLKSTNQAQLWTTLSPHPNWVSPPEVVDLTLDEDAGHKYLL